MMLARFSRQWRGGLFLAGLVPTLWPSVAPGSEAATADPVTLLLPGPPSFRYAGYYAAAWNGHFAEEGLKVELEHRASAGSTVEAVVPQASVYGVGATDFVLARLEGRPVVLVTAILQETPEALALATPVGSHAALEGRDLALRPPVESAALRLMLRRGHVEPGFDARELGGGAAGDASGPTAWQIDGLDANARAILRPADHGVIMFYGDSLFTSEAELAYHPQRVQALRRAVLRGWEQALRNPAEVIHGLEQRRAVWGADSGSRAELQQEAELLRGLIKPSTVPLGTVEPARIHEMAEGLVELGLAPRVAYLENFIYAPQPPWVPRWVYAVAIALGVSAAGGLVVVFFNIRLQRRVAERTQELRRSEQRAKQIFEHAPVAIIEQDFSAVCRWLDERQEEGVTDLKPWLHQHPDELARLYATVRPVQANSVALRSAGVTSLAELAAQTAEPADPGVLAGFREQLLALWRGERAVSVEVVRSGGDGPGQHALVQWTVPEIDGISDFQRVLLVCTDLTPLRQAEEKARESDARFRTLFESAIEGVYESTPSDGLVLCNPAMARILGGETPAQVLVWARERGAESLYVEANRRSEFLKTLARGSAVRDFESEVHGVDGSRRWISESARAVRDAAGAVVRIQGFVSDISERKRFERVLAEERERLSVTLRAMREGVITTDRAGVVQYLNEAAEHLTGWAEGAAIGRPVSEVCVLRHERSQAAVSVPVDETMRGERVVDLPPATVLVDRQEQSRLVEGRCAPVHDAKSQAIGMVMVLRDVAERSRLEAEMVRNSKLESLGVLAGGIAHDFNNLLTGILGNVTLAQLDRGLPETAGRWLKDAETASVRARELTRQLLTFAKGGDPVRTTVRLAEVVREAADFALHGSRVRCEFTVSTDLWPADVDKGQIGQVVQNLVINAVQAMPEGGVVRIKLINESHDGDAVRAIVPGAYLRFEISDEGTGIRPENLGRIFDPYFTTKATGSGLGLAMVYSIVKKHDGHIEVDSELGLGTTFRILLPALPAALPPAIVREEQTGPMAGRVLFMDDQESIRRMAVTLLERLGFEVVAVRDGAEVVREYSAARDSARPFDVVLMDLTVPGGVGGREAMESLRQLDPEVRAIVSSGYSSDPVLANYRAHGFRARVAKPYRASDLARVLREVLTEGLSASQESRS